MRAEVEVVEAELGFIATVWPDGSPNLSRKVLYPAWRERGRLAEFETASDHAQGGEVLATWSVRVSLANLNELDYLKIGHHVRAVLDGYRQEWQVARR